VEARTGTLTLDRFHGLFEHTPFLAAMFLLTGLASIGFPGTVGFIGTELLIEGAVKVYPLVGFAVVLAAALNSIAVVKAYFHVFTGARHQSTASLGCRPAERITILIMVVLIIGGGLIPQPGVQSRYHAAIALLAHRQQHTPSEQSESSHYESIEKKEHP
ncbi:MAG: oxidoreductase, partial [bacterium]|nr:oxidoreductase [bacterium]